MPDKVVESYLDMLESNRRSGAATEAPGFFQRGAFKKAVKLQGEKLKKKITDTFTDDIMESQSKLRRAVSK